MDEDGDLGLQNLFIENKNDLKINLEFTTANRNEGGVVKKFIYHLRTKKVCSASLTFHGESVVKIYGKPVPSSGFNFFKFQVLFISMSFSVELSQLDTFEKIKKRAHPENRIYDQV